MIIDEDGNVKKGFPEFAIKETYHVKYNGYSGEPVYWSGDVFGEDLIGYNLPPSHFISAWHEKGKYCAYCGAESALLEIDHIVPYALGGAHLQREFSAVDNKALSCSACNLRKGKELGWTTLDGRSGFYWDGTPGHSKTPPPMPNRAKNRK